MGQQPWLIEAESDSAATLRFELLYDHHVRAVTAYCGRRLPDDQVADAVAETFLVLWRRLDEAPDGDGTRLWLYRVAFRVVGRAWRSSTRRNRLRDRLGSRRPVDDPGPEEAALQDDEVRRVLAAADRLTPSDAEVLRLAAWERLEPADIASVLDIERNAVHQRLHRARRNLLRAYETVDRSSGRRQVSGKESS